MRREEEFWYRFEYEISGQADSGVGRAWSVAYDFVDSVKLAVVLLMLVFSFLLRPVCVQGSSMLPTLSNGDWVASFCCHGSIERGDIVIITQPEEGSRALVKRVIAVGGDRVDIDFSSGEVYVNGQMLDEPYINSKTYLRYDVTFPIDVPEGCLFVMGDNRNDSKDSRSSEIGLIDERYILGEVKFRFFPLGRFKIN